MRSTIRPNGNNINYWVEKINDTGWVEFDSVRAVSTAGDIRPPYPYQWIAATKPREGDDEPFEGLGATPLQAVKELYELLSQNDFIEEDEP